MWQNKLNGILGLWIIVLAFLAFSESMHRILLVLTGLAITIIAFFGKKLIRSPKELVKYSENQKLQVQDKESSPDIKPVA